MAHSDILGASFRDPSGFLFKRGGILYRQVNRIYEENFTHLMESGLFENLVNNGLLVPHAEVEIKPAEPSVADKVIKPEPIPFISYPYEWSFSQLKDAALTTLTIQKHALKFGMSLKDASAYNVQFVKGKPILIDTLSFEIYKEGEPWVAYRQFCQHFIAPLALMAYSDIRLSQLLRIYIDGIPLDLASELLPRPTHWNLGLNLHIHLHAKAQKHYADIDVSKARHGRRMSQSAMLGMIENIIHVIQKLEWKLATSEWVGYYDITNYTDAAREHKKQLVMEWTGKVKPNLVWDMGANTGFFSRSVLHTGAYIISSDFDSSAVEQNYQMVKSSGEQKILPLVLDITNPSPALGWHNRERESFLERGPVDVILALAIIHHLAITNNVPLSRLAELFYHCCNWLVIEFIPKSDSQVKKLLRNREDIFPDYTRQGFEQIFSQYFKIQQSSPLKESERWLYLMRKK